MRAKFPFVIHPSQQFVLPSRARARLIHVSACCRIVCTACGCMRAHIEYLENRRFVVTGRSHSLEKRVKPFNNHNTVTFLLSSFDR